MPPKQLHGKGRTVAEPSFAQTTLHAFTDKENRSVVTAVGMFAVRQPPGLDANVARKRAGRWTDHVYSFNAGNATNNRLTHFM
jgi:hypothetical protein